MDDYNVFEVDTYDNFLLPGIFQELFTQISGRL